jgi:hypothetical protein
MMTEQRAAKLWDHEHPTEAATVSQAAATTGRAAATAAGPLRTLVNDATPHGLQGLLRNKLTRIAE